MSDKKYYRPLPDVLTIDEAKWLSKITGRRQLGLFSTGAINKGENLGVTHYDDKRINDGLIRTPLGGFFNHSETPNCHLIEESGIFYLVTIKKVLEGEELTVLYKTYDPTK